jgi:4-hydroxybenzoate polyprenyltransferase
MNFNPTKFVAQAKNAPVRALLATIAVAMIAPITVQRDWWIVLPLIAILAAIVRCLICSDRKRQRISSSLARRASNSPSSK